MRLAGSGAGRCAEADRGHAGDQSRPVGLAGSLDSGCNGVRVTAVDARGRKATSNLLVVITLPDRVAPSTPANVRVTDVTASKVSLAWDASTDNAEIAEYLLSASPSTGRVIFTGPTSLDLIALPPETTFTLAVRARDFGWNSSPFSAPVTATTKASTDVTPPTVPANLRVGNVDWCGEVEAWAAIA